MTTDETLNELLVRLFKDIMEIEGKCLVTEEFKDLSYNDFHVIEAIGVNEPKTMTTVAKLMNVTTGTLTKAMDGLTRKGYVIRERSTQDKRVVWVYLTDTGKAAYKHHEEFHHEMIAQIKSQLTEQETPILIYALAKLADYFHLDATHIYYYFCSILILLPPITCYRKILTINDAIEINVPTAENHNVVDEPIDEF